MTWTYLIPLIKRPSVPFATALHVLDLVHPGARHTKHLLPVSDPSLLVRELGGAYGDDDPIGKQRLEGNHCSGIVGLFSRVSFEIPREKGIDGVHKALVH